MQARSVPKPPVFESQRMRDGSHKRQPHDHAYRPNYLSNYTFQTQQRYYMDKNSPGKQFKSDVTN